MPVILSVVAVGAFFLVAATIEGMLDGKPPSELTKRSNKRRKTRRSEQD